MPNHLPDFYKSILEASERGELWGINSKQNYWTQLEFDLDNCKKK